MFDISDAALENLEKIVKETESLAGEKEEGGGGGGGPSGAEADQKGNIVVKSINFQVPIAKVESSLDSLAKMTQIPDYNDAMEIVWFSFDPKKEDSMFEQMSLLTTINRASMDGNAKPIVDLAKLYRERYQAAVQELEQEQGRDASTSARVDQAPAKRRF